MSQQVPTLVRPPEVKENRGPKSSIYIAIWITTMLAMVASLSYLTYITPRFQDVDPQDSTLVPATPGDWSSQQDRLAVLSILANFGHAGAKAYGAADGILLDSPLPEWRDHLWTRVRDSNIVFKVLIDRFVRTGDQQLQLAINSYITAQASAQTAYSPSGTLDDGKGLAEPRFLPNITADPTNFGRPKHDGAALRAIALMTYGRWLFNHGYTDAARDIVWPIVRNDLNYVGEYWSQPGLNFWSRPSDVKLVHSFFMTSTHHRTLVEGATFAKAIGQDCTYCESQAPQILCALQEYGKVGQSAEQEHAFIAAELLNGTIPIPNGRDTSTLLSAISNFDPEAACNDETFQPCSPLILRNHKEVVDQFRGWAINTGIETGKAVAIGRFLDDSNGNASYVSTLAAAELLYDALYTYSKSASITITNISLPFWSSIYPPARTGSFRSGTSSQAEANTYAALYAALKVYADAFVDIVRAHIPEDGSMSERFGSLDRKPGGAIDMSWSYGAWLSMMDRREGRVPASWGALGAIKVPGSCSVESFKGTYRAADKIQWPKFPCKPVAKVQVTFNLLVPGVGEGDTVYVYGDIPELGMWDEGTMVRMDGSRYDEKRVPLWSVAVNIPAGTDFKYRYKRDGGDGSKSKIFEFRVGKETCWYADATDDTWAA